jgi:hypothetical protein
VTGHSLGGCLATMVAPYLRAMFSYLPLPFPRAQFGLVTSPTSPADEFTCTGL